LNSKYPINIAGFENKRTELEVSGLFGKTRILVNGVPAEKGIKRDEYILYSADGTRTSIKLQGVFFDIIPRIIINGETFEILSPLRWYQYGFAGLSLILMIIGGGIGGILGMIGFITNIRILRSSIPPPMRYLLILFMNVLVLFIYTLLASIIQVLFQEL
jgi:hypothetical protein